MIFFDRLEDIYCYDFGDHFRHYYSDLFSTLTIIDSHNEGSDLNILAENMNMIKNKYHPRDRFINGKVVDVSKEINKLYDHINLEIARINYNKEIGDYSWAQLQITQKHVATAVSENKELKIELENQANKFKTELENQANMFSEEIKRTQSDMQKDYITILGIFTSVVLAFTGGMFFSSSVLENISEVSIYRLTFIVVLLGCMLFDVMWLLIDYLKYINSKKSGGKALFIIVNIIGALSVVAIFIFYKLQLI